EERHHDRVLQQTHALVIFKIDTAKHTVYDQSAHNKISTDNNRAEDTLPQIRNDAENVKQIAIHLINKAVVVPRLSEPKPLPAGPANEDADENHKHPQNDETEKKNADSKLALPPY